MLINSDIDACNQAGIPRPCGYHLNENADLYTREARLDEEILSIKYPPKGALRPIRNNIMQEWKDKHRYIGKSNGDRLFFFLFFYKIHPFMTLRPAFLMPTLRKWKIKVLHRVTSNHTYDKVY